MYTPILHYINLINEIGRWNHSDESDGKGLITYMILQILALLTDFSA